MKDYLREIIITVSLIALAILAVVYMQETINNIPVNQTVVTTKGQ